jgi:hypothetical protein
MTGNVGAIGTTRRRCAASGSGVNWQKSNNRERTVAFQRIRGCPGSQT